MDHHDLSYLTDQEVADCYYYAIEDDRPADAAMYEAEAKKRGMIL